MKGFTTFPFGLDRIHEWFSYFRHLRAVTPFSYLRIAACGTDYAPITGSIFASLADIGVVSARGAVPLCRAGAIDFTPSAVGTREGYVDGGSGLVFFNRFDDPLHIGKEL